MKLFFATLGFLTRFPVFFQDDTILPSEEFTKGIVFYPWIGLLVGVTSAVIFYFPYYLGYSLVAAILAVLAEILVTGAFHLDGLSDTCDGLFSSRNKERMLEIMHDSRAGTNGVAAIVFDILLKTALLYSIPSRLVFQAIILAPVAGKMITPVLMKSRYARTNQGLGSMYLKDIYSVPMLMAIVFGIIILGAGLQEKAILPCITAFFSAFLFRRYCCKKIGGMTGDTLGAGYEIGETVFLLTVLLQGGLL